ncbi:MAG: hypothetical protein ACYDAZ_04840 [Thermoplasmataceae archaeon]
MDIQSLLSVLIRAIQTALFSSAGGLWFLTVRYGLSPGYAYLGNEIANNGFLGIYYYFLNGYFTGLLSILLIISAAYFLVRNSLGLKVSAGTTMVRGFLALTLSLFSFDICRMMLEYSGLVYTGAWNNLNTNWYALVPAPGTGGISSIPQISGSTVLSVFFLTSYYIATGSLLSMLEIRQAILLVLMIILPIFSLLLLIPDAEKIPIGMWKLFAEMLIVPFLVLTCIAIASVLPDDPLLQIALILLASGSPFLLHNNSRILYGAGMMGTFSGLMSGMASLRYGVSGAVADAAGRYTPTLGLSFKGANGPVETKGGNDYRIDWGEVFRKELYERTGDI